MRRAIRDPDARAPRRDRGAIAVAVAAAVVFSGERDPRALLELVAARTPPGATQAGVQRSIAMLAAEPAAVAAELGSGRRVLALDTVPFAVWRGDAPGRPRRRAVGVRRCRRRYRHDLREVGGIVVGAVGLAGTPADWHAARERLPT